MVGAVVIARFRLGIGSRDPAIGYQRGFEIGVEPRLAGADHGYVSRRTGHLEGVHIDPAHRLRQREHRVLGIIMRAQQTRFLGGHREEHQAARRRACLGMRFGQCDQRRGAGGVVDRAVADVVAIGRRLAAAEVIPMRGVDDVFVGPLATRQHTDHVLGLEAADIVGEAGRGLEPQRHRLEAPTPGSGREFGQVISRGVEDLRCDVLLHPAIDLRQRRRVRPTLGISLRTRPAALDHVPAVGGGCGVVNDDRTRGTLSCGFLVFIGPASVEGHRLAVEGAGQVLAGIIGVVDEDHRGLAAHVDALVIVPVALGRVHAVADEHQLAVGQCGSRILAIGHADPFVAELERHGFALASHRQGGEILAGDLDQRHLLHPGAVVARLQPGLGEALAEQRHGLFLAHGSRHPPFEFVGRQRAGHIDHRLPRNVAPGNIGNVERGGAIDKRGVAAGHGAAGEREARDQR